MLNAIHFEITNVAENSELIITMFSSKLKEINSVDISSIGQLSRVKDVEIIFPSDGYDHPMKLLIKVAKISIKKRLR